MKLVMELTEKLGKRLKMVRVASGLKQKELANELSIPAPLLSMYEQGKREPSLAFLEKFAERFQLSMSQLFALIEDIPSESNKKVSVDSLIAEMKGVIAQVEKAAAQNITG